MIDTFYENSRNFKIQKILLCTFQFSLTHGTISRPERIRGKTESLWNLECGVFQSDRSYEFYKEPFYQSYSSPRELSPSFIYANSPSNTNFVTKSSTNLCMNFSTFKPNVINFCCINHLFKWFYFIMTDFPRIPVFTYILTTYIFCSSFLDEKKSNENLFLLKKLIF